MTPTATPSGPRRARWASWLLLAAATAFAAGVAELTLRALGQHPMRDPERGIFWVHDPLLGWHHRPGQHGFFEIGDLRTEVRINSRGLRDREYPHQRVAGQRRILVVGDSFAWGFGVEQDEAFSERMEASLTGVEVINAGVSGFSTDQELLWLRSEGVKYRPDLVILLLAGNDEEMNRRRAAFLVYSKPYFVLDENGHLELRGVPVPLPPALRRLAYLACTRSALVNFVTGRSARVLRRLRARGESRAGAGGKRQPFELTVALIDEMRRVAEGAGARFMIGATGMYWPLETHTRFDQLTAALERRGIELIDVEADGFDPQHMRLPGDGHWSPDGHAIVARRVLEFIDRRKLLKSASGAKTKTHVLEK